MSGVGHGYPIIGGMIGSSIIGLTLIVGFLILGGFSIGISGFGSGGQGDGRGGAGRGIVRLPVIAVLDDDVVAPLTDLVSCLVIISVWIFFTLIIVD